MNLINTYKKEIDLDTQIDQLNILDKQMRQPAIRHKWVARLIDAKRDLNRLEKKKKETRRAAVEILSANLPKGLPKASLDAKIDASEKMQAINDDIAEAELLIDYLERVEKIFASLTYDFKTITELIKMETA